MDHQPISGWHLCHQPSRRTRVGPGTAGRAQPGEEGRAVVRHEQRQLVHDGGGLVTAHGWHPDGEHSGLHLDRVPSGGVVRQL